jgi:hypothetical protein
MELGMMDPPTHVRYNRLGAADLRTKEHVDLSYQACRGHSFSGPKRQLPHHSHYEKDSFLDLREYWPCLRRAQGSFLVCGLPSFVAVPNLLALYVQAALEGICLYKNNGGVLPLEAGRGAAVIAVIGPWAVGKSVCSCAVKKRSVSIHWSQS